MFTYEVEICTQTFDLGKVGKPKIETGVYTYNDLDLESAQAVFSEIASTYRDGTAPTRVCNALILRTVTIYQVWDGMRTIMDCEEVGFDEFIEEMGL